MHCDVKPQNVLIGMDGSCKLSDFGSCTRVAEAAAEPDCFTIRGTPLYMSPEVTLGNPPVLVSDIWSFGITVFELLMGRTPWDLTTPSQEYNIHRLMNNDTAFMQFACKGLIEPRIDELNEPARSFVGACLQKDPQRRPTTADLLIHPFFL